MEVSIEIKFPGETKIGRLPSFVIICSPTNFLLIKILLSLIYPSNRYSAIPIAGTPVAKEK